MAAITDPIADMLTRIRNAIMAGHYSLRLPASKIKTRIADILLKEGFIHSYEFLEDKVQGEINISLKYVQENTNAIQGLKRVSRPGCRVYARSRHIPRIRNGLGIAILSTSQGIFSDKEARERRVGGEILCYVW